MLINSLPVLIGLCLLLTTRSPSFPPLPLLAMILSPFLKISKFVSFKPHLCLYLLLTSLNRKSSVMLESKKKRQTDYLSLLSLGLELLSLLSKTWRLYLLLLLQLLIKLEKLVCRNLFPLSLPLPSGLTFSIFSVSLPGGGVDVNDPENLPYSMANYVSHIPLSEVPLFEFPPCDAFVPHFVFS